MVIKTTGKRVWDRAHQITAVPIGAVTAKTIVNRIFKGRIPLIKHRTKTSAP